MFLAKLPPGELTDAVRAMRRVFLAVGAFSLAINLLMLLPSIYMLQTYDRVLTSRNEGTLLALTVILLGLLALEATLEFIRSRVLQRMGASLDLQLDGRIFDAMAQAGLRGETDSARALGDLGQVRGFLTGRGLLAIFDGPWLPIYLLVIFLLHPVLGLFASAAAAILLALAWFNEQATAQWHQLASSLQGQANGFARSALRNGEVLHVLGMLPALRQRWMTRQLRHLAVQGEAIERGARIDAVVRLLRLSFQSGILGLGAWLVLKDQMTAGGMVAASILLGRALAPVDQAISSWRGVVAARAAFGRLNRLLREHAQHKTSVTLPDPQGTISVENLHVQAPGQREAILRGLSFQIGAGKAIAVVGPSASGKSTLARALVGAWPSAAGHVRLDGADIGQWERQHLAGFLGYLPQDVELFDGSVAENIARFGAIDSAKVVEAARRAGVHDMILRLPAGYETVIGEGGLVLSGGQRQRVALARALYGDPVLVVLDEPDASIDQAGGQALLYAIQELKQRARTLFVVTHRSALLAEMDAVMVMAEGRIKAFMPVADYLAQERGAAPAPDKLQRVPAMSAP